MQDLKNAFLFITLLCVPIILAAQDRSLIKEGATVVKLADGFGFTEGPAVDKNGNIYFTDQPNDKILKWSVADKQLSEFLTNTGRANGLYFDKKGNLLSCSDMDNEMWKIRMDGKHEVIVSAFENKKLNGPNDLWIHPKGGIYFTDPLYVRNYWTRDPKMQQEGQSVYYLSPDYKKLVPVDANLEQPNGIVGDSRGEQLYVADIKAGKTYVYQIQKNGMLANRKLFVSMGSDGMTIDELGNLYLTGNGVTVFNPSGEKILHIPIHANWTANLCFGGKDMKTLFITASENLYSIEMNVAGVR